MNIPTSLFMKGGKMSIPGAAELGFDPQEMKAKYDFERDRRLRPDREAQSGATDWDAAGVGNFSAARVRTSPTRPRRRARRAR